MGPLTEKQHAYGLSPRVRGKLKGMHPCLKDDRSIPACAGEAAALFSLSSSTAVYPRVCGGSRWAMCWTP